MVSPCEQTTLRVCTACFSKPYSSRTSLSSMVSAQSTDSGSSQHVVEDEFHVTWDFDLEAQGEVHVPHASAVAPPAAKPGEGRGQHSGSARLVAKDVSPPVFAGPPKLMRSSSSQVGKTKPTVSKAANPPGRTIVLKVRLVPSAKSYLFSCPPSPPRRSFKL